MMDIGDPADENESKHMGKTYYYMRDLKNKRKEGRGGREKILINFIHLNFFFII